MQTCRSSSLPFSRVPITVGSFTQSIQIQWTMTYKVLANGYFNVYGNAARKDEHDYVVGVRTHL